MLSERNTSSTHGSIAYERVFNKRVTKRTTSRDNSPVRSLRRRSEIQVQHCCWTVTSLELE